MKILWWETEDPQDRIILITLVLIPLYYLFRGVCRSELPSPNIADGIVHKIGGLYGGYVGSGAWWTYMITFYLMAILSLMIVYSALQVCLRWYRRHNSI